MIYENCFLYQYNPSSMYFVISMRFLNCLCNPRQRIFSAVSTVLQSGRKENAIFKLLIFFNREELCFPPCFLFYCPGSYCIVRSTMLLTGEGRYWGTREHSCWKIELFDQFVQNVSPVRLYRIDIVLYKLKGCLWRTVLFPLSDFIIRETCDVFFLVWKRSIDTHISANKCFCFF